MENVYVITNLIENDDYTEVKVIGVKKSEADARNLLIELLGEIEENYQNNDMEYSYEDNGDSIDIVTEDMVEKMTIEYQVCKIG